jgi:hypothetical protein
MNNYDIPRKRVTRAKSNGARHWIFSVRHWIFHGAHV